MKVAILDSEGRLMLFRSPERITETWRDGKCSIEAQMKADNSGIVFESFRSASAKLLTEYFEVGEVPGRTITQSQMLTAIESATVGDTCGVRPYLFAAKLGLFVVPDPEPTNAEKIKDALMKADREGVTRSPDSHGYDGLAEWLDKAGVKAPDGDES